MYETYKDRANFLTVYIKEAHAQDEWQMDANEKENVCYPQPRSLKDRVAIAYDFARRFDYRVPLVVDDMDNKANALYAGWPERIYVLDERGTIVFKGKPGPLGYHPEEGEPRLAKRLPAKHA